MIKTLQNLTRNQLIIIISGAFIVILLLFALLRDNKELISRDMATSLIEDDKIEKALLDGDFIYLISKKDEIYKISTDVFSIDDLAHIKVQKSSNMGWLWLVILSLAVYAIYRWLVKNELPKVAPVVDEELKVIESEKPLEVENSDIVPAKSYVKFSDIGGINDVKEELEEILDFLRNPKRYHSFGARMPRGVLMVGPPGVGKTMIAKALATEAGVPFYYQSAASFVQIYVGMGAKRVSELFSVAKKSAPAIIFIDEIDAIGKRRDGTRNEEREGTLNQLLVEMDGFDDSSGIIVVAATNNIDILDSALLRAGRFDRRIFVELPTAQERELILQKYLREIPHDLSISAIAKMTTGFNGASLAALVNEAALLALRSRDIHVTMEHFMVVKEKVMFGKKRVSVMSDEQRNYQVRYQAGKVFMATLYDLSFDKISLSNEMITPPTSEPMLQREIESHIRVHLAGVAASSIAFGEHASNAKSDLDSAKVMVKKMIHEYAMGDRIYPNGDDEHKLMSRLYSETRVLISNNEEAISKISKVLDDYEQISKSLCKEIIDEIL